MANCPTLPRSGVTERFPNWTQAGVRYCRLIPVREPVQAEEPLTEFWAKETGASKIGNRSPDPDPLTRGDDLADHVAEDVGQPEIAAGMTEGEAFVVEAQELQHRRVQVVNRDRILDGPKPEVVGRSMDGSALDPAARHPEGKTPMVMVPALRGSRSVLTHLHRRRSPELSAAQDEGALQHPSLL